MIFRFGYPFHGWLLLCFPFNFCLLFFLLLIFFLFAFNANFNSLKLLLLYCCISSTHMHSEYCILYVYATGDNCFLNLMLQFEMVKRALFVAAFRIRFLIHANGNTFIDHWLNGPFTWKKSFQHRQIQIEHFVKE